MVSSLTCFPTVWHSAIPTSCYIFDVFYSLFMSLFLVPMQELFQRQWQTANLICHESSSGDSPHAVELKKFHSYYHHYNTMLNSPQFKSYYLHSVQQNLNSFAQLLQKLVVTWPHIFKWCPKQGRISWTLKLIKSNRVMHWSRKMHFELAHLKKKENQFWPLGDFVVQYIRNTSLHH